MAPRRWTSPGPGVPLVASVPEILAAFCAFSCSLRSERPYSRVGAMSRAFGVTVKVVTGQLPIARCLSCSR